MNNLKTCGDRSTFITLKLSFLSRHQIFLFIKQISLATAQMYLSKGALLLWLNMLSVLQRYRYAHRLKQSTDIHVGLDFWSAMCYQTWISCFGYKNPALMLVFHTSWSFEISTAPNRFEFLDRHNFKVTFLPFHIH